MVGNKHSPAGLAYVLTADGDVLRTEFKGAIPDNAKTGSAIDVSKILITRIADVDPEFNNRLKTGLHTKTSDIAIPKNLLDGLNRDWK